MIRKFLFIIGYIILSFLLLAGVLYFAEYKPKETETVYVASQHCDYQLKDTISVLSWNIGYCGLGADVDFFYDGGKQVRSSKEKVVENLEKITEFIRKSDVDFILLQEVDIDSKRSYGINQFEYIRKAIGYYGVFALNYNSFFVPIPLREPIGRVKGGVAIFSKVEPLQSVRYQYPGEFTFPVSVFNLKRCMLSALYNINGSDYLVINNTHNSAYDDGSMRSQETKFIADITEKQYQNGFYVITAGDWNQTPPDYRLSEAEINDKYFSVKPLDTEPFDKKWSFVSDTDVPSARYLYQPYIKGSTTTTTLDYVLISPNIETLNFKTVNNEFQNSDHNPIIGRFLMKF